MKSKYSLVIVDNEDNTMIKINPINLVIEDPSLIFGNDIVTQSIHIEYCEYKLVDDVAKYLSKLFFEIKERVDEGYDL